MASSNISPSEETPIALYNILDPEAVEFATENNHEDGAVFTVERPASGSVLYYVMFEDKLIRAINDNRSLFGNKYEKGIQQMLIYYRTSGVLQANGIPPLSKRVK